ncbi:putative transcriptional regulator [Chloroherpeton thalassium ATCC 35110]|uniref:Putative transcriptional regulator n=1 Tax=Chloroherpeton thalassium (strain ATCC 35110 / GB-78) TaxID=517418 RepID=B3QWA3_CHLT3|nr:ATP-binding protein [Chloroherpeton thalassium]ACF13216.1 putative transcriptional regulator [Chloroherpeton thalassium ATCC 35110]
MYTDAELLRLVERGENVQIEFKRLVHSPEKIAKSMVAFANTAGGVILIGVDDDKRIVGIESEKETIEIIDEAAHEFVAPKINYVTDVVEFRARDVLMVTVEESERKPHFHISYPRHSDTLKRKKEKKVYIRKDSHNVAATREEVHLMEDEEKPLIISYGENEQLLFRYLDTYHRITLKEFSKLVNISTKRASIILISLVRAGVIHLHNEGKQNYYTLAAS